MLVRMLMQFGIDEKRCRFDYISAGEGEKFVTTINDMVEQVRSLGPLQSAS
jgi:F420-non-reducing hydrogenase iron-sulfur subunit